MKNLLFIAAIAIILAGCSRGKQLKENEYRISVTVAGVKDSTEAYLQHIVDGSWRIDTTLVINNRFEFADTTNSEPSFAIIRIDTGVEADDETEPDILQFLLERGEIVIVSNDSLKNSVFETSETNKDFAEWKRFSEDFYQRVNLANENNDEAALDALEKENIAYNVQFIKSHPSSYIAFYSLSSIIDKINIDESISLFSLLSPELKETKDGKEFEEQIEGQKKTAVGSIAPDFTQNTPDGKPVKLSDFRGKYLLLDFWASWCHPCRAENPNVVRAYNQFKDKNFTILGVSLDNGEKDGLEKWKKAIADDKLSWTHVSDLKYWNNEARKLYGVSSIPSNFLIDPEGKIIASNLRGDDLLKKLEEILK